MTRLALIATLGVAACSGPSSTVPSGFGGDCDYGPRIGGAAGMGVGSEGLMTDIDARIVMGARTDGGCVGASLGRDDD